MSFWTDVRPSHRPRIRRLVLYWFALAAPLLVMMATYAAQPLMQRCLLVRQARQRTATAILAMPNHPAHIRAIKVHGTAQAAAAAINPMPSLQQSLDLLLIYRWQWLRSAKFALMTIAWPLIVTLSFIAFRDTLRQARIKSIHVFRCAVYSADAGLIVALAMVPLLQWRQDVSDQSISNHWIFAYLLFDPIVLLGVLSWLALLSYRLGVAYWTYLGFRHAVVVTLWSEMIFFILLLVIVE